MPCVGDLVKLKTDVIVNPANVSLRHEGGAALAIATAAGDELVEDCKIFIRSTGGAPLQTSKVMHTRPGKLRHLMKFVIHAAGPDARLVKDPVKCYNLLKDTFFHCLIYANNILQVGSIAIPAISSGKIKFLPF